MGVQALAVVALLGVGLRQDVLQAPRGEPGAVEAVLRLAQVLARLGERKGGHGATAVVLEGFVLDVRVPAVQSVLFGGGMERGGRCGRSKADVLLGRRHRDRTVRAGVAGFS